MLLKLPQFKYHPNAYQLDIFTQESGICSVCHQQRSIKYNLGLYSVDEPEYICPWCIANGQAAEKYNGDFNDYCSIEGVSEHYSEPNPMHISEQALDIITQKTPSYAAWQQEVWLVHCDEPCAFLGYVGMKEIMPYFDDVKADIEQSGYDIEDIKNALSADGEMVGYFFECVHCGKKRLHIDCN